VVVEGPGYADGARKERTRDEFVLRLVPGGTLVARLGASLPSRISVRVDGSVMSTLDLGPSPADELGIPIPHDLREGPHDIVVSAEGGSTTFDSLHYWVYR
jgi:hypothetical protein